LNWRKENNLITNHYENNRIKRINSYKLKQSLKRKYSSINNDCISFITGTLLGDASISKKITFKYSHKLEHKDYVIKKAELINLKGSYYESYTKLKGVKFPCYIFSAYTHPIFNKYRKLFYPEDKKVFPVEHCKKYLNWKAFALWFGDDGCYLKGRGVALAVFALSSRIEDIRKILKENLNLDCTIHGKEKGILYFSKKDLPYIRKNIIEFLPECLHYKLGSV